MLLIHNILTNIVIVGTIFGLVWLSYQTWKELTSEE